MPSKRKGPAKTTEAPSWQVILEEMRSQNRATMEALQLERELIEQRFQRVDEAIRQNTADLREVFGAVHGLQSLVHGMQTDLRDMREAVKKAATLESRVSALEKRTA